MKIKIAWSSIGVILFAIIGMTLMKNPSEVIGLLERTVDASRGISMAMHMIFIGILAVGILSKKSRNVLFAGFITLISLSAAVTAVRYMILPNIVVFFLFALLIIQATVRKKLNFDSFGKDPIRLVFGGIGLLFGFWYLHWVKSPVWLNALIYSPLGVVNCPTMVTVCGFLILSDKPGSPLLEMTAALVTLYFGLFGIFRLAAYTDIVLIICSTYLFVRNVKAIKNNPVATEAGFHPVSNS